ncbi:MULTISPECIES: ferritin-like domain-containing protein [Kitasatospora]|uniref:Ferritin-like protein n=1 Tax=Kitasatospora cathayae TaxID=3004092 RepID=A0ABY7Q336_9ACTN|nr:ferritin-like protein [Kitasatospora sp. HUAS 3-15]WBP87103.1 ferritin-like protein [Kitasatospora sp. HUAS 3-15]
MTTGILDYESDAIVQLMSIAEDDWTEKDLKDALQRAIMLEVSTIAPYATALWSITDADSGKPVAQTIRDIIFDEMWHFGLVCNMLTSIGGTVVLTDPATVPKYPGELPGGVNPGLVVYLSGLSRDSAKLFSDIEKPENPLAFAADGNTIGAFYQRIANVFPKYAHLLSGQRQVSTSPGGKREMIEMKTIDDVLRAIRIIQTQGEGTSASPEDPSGGGPSRLAHYYAFKEIAEGRKLVFNDMTRKWEFTGDAVPLPDTSPVAKVPGGGWPRQGDPNSPDQSTAKLLNDFNKEYSDMLRALEQAWAGAPNAISTAIAMMGAMRGSAQQIAGVKLPADPRFRYGPEWLLVQ